MNIQLGNYEYDISQFIDKHLGGEIIKFKEDGIDYTFHFLAFHRHSQKAHI